MPTNRFTEQESGVVQRDGEVSVLCLAKGEERYLFVWDDDHRAEMLRTLGRFASNPDLSFTWMDAAVLSKKVREGIPQG